MGLNWGTYNLDAERLQQLNSVLAGSLGDQSDDLVLSVARRQQRKRDRQVATAGYYQGCCALDLLGGFQS